MDHTNFQFSANFPTLTGLQIDAAILAVGIEWAGCFDTEVSGVPNCTGLFQGSPHDLKVAKQNILLGYLTGWWLADMYPAAVQGVSGDGGMPLTSKSIGGVSMSRKDLDMQSAMKQLETNAFGVKALSMLKSAPEMFRMFGRGRSLGPGSRGYLGLPGSTI